MNTRRQLFHNIYIDDLARRFLGLSYNKEIIHFIGEIQDIDSIKDYDYFREYLKYLPETPLNTTYTIKRTFSENTMYGYAYELMRYAGLESENLLYLPFLEHGIDLREGVHDDGYMNNVSYIMQGSRNYDEWKKTRKEDCYCIGPYIHYSAGYYNNDIISDIKEEYGKILLIFPPHTTEYGDKVVLLDDFYDNTLSRIVNHFDSIFACVFWSDVNKEYTKKMESFGAKLVSAGFKLDPYFVRRLKTIIELSDAVLYPAFTTSLGYAYYLGKEVICYQYDLRDGYGKDNYFVKPYIESFCRLFSYKNNYPEQDRKNLIEEYWGTSLVKTPSEIRDIYYSNKNRIIRRFGF